MWKGILLIVAIISISTVEGVDLSLHTSASQNASSGLILLSSSPSGTAMNPSYLAKGFETGITYLYNFRELPYYTAHLSSSYQNFGFYTGINYLDHPLYQEAVSNISVNYQGSFFAAGACIRVLYNRVSNYESGYAALFDSGFILTHENLRTSFAVRNITRTRFQGNMLPAVLLWELNYELSSYSSLSIGAEKEYDYDFTLKMGGYYRFHPYIALLSSYQFEPDRIGAGVIILPSPLRVVYSILSHRYLNPTHYLSLYYEK